MTLPPPNCKCIYFFKAFSRQNRPLRRLRICFELTHHQQSLFFYFDGLTKSVPADRDEIMIVEQGMPTFCFKRTNPESSRFGWCRTAGNFYDRREPHYGDQENGWGYCSKDCYLHGRNEELSGVLRVVDDVDVCKKFKVKSTY